MELLGRFAEVSLNVLKIIAMFSIVLIILSALKAGLEHLKLKKKAQLYLAMRLLIEQGSEIEKNRLALMKTQELDNIAEKKLLDYTIIRELNKQELNFLVPYFKRVTKEKLLFKQFKQFKNEANH